MMQRRNNFMSQIKRALISVTDKNGIVEFARKLSSFGVEILSTGGTAAQLRKSGITVKDVSEYTGFPEMMDGRLKTLHPKIHGGLLALRDNPEHVKSMKQQGIEPIDMVVINLYQFEDTVAKEGCTVEHAIENIDIGGPTMLRAAAKNYRFVSVITDPADYSVILTEMGKTGGKVSEATNFRLAVKTFQTTARYDGAISNYLGTISPEGTKKEFPDTFTAQYTMVQALRYGENPHQKAAFYRENDASLAAISNAKQLQGKELSYNNIMDSDAAWLAVSDFALPAAVIIKHANPCGAATSNSGLVDAYEKALATDPVSAFGGIVAFNRPVDNPRKTCVCWKYRPRPENTFPVMIFAASLAGFLFRNATLFRLISGRPKLSQKENLLMKNIKLSILRGVWSSTLNPTPLFTRPKTN
jgi:phosphoribosylaminoimidazolecarboxamide formyltransferase/IMP cyclohydrolase